MGWYDQILLVDTTVVSMMFLTLSVLIEYWKRHQRKYLFLAGILTTATIWTKYVAIALFLPIIAILLHKSVRDRIKLKDFIIGFLVSQLMFISLISTYNPHPLDPIIRQASIKLGIFVDIPLMLNSRSLGFFYYLVMIPFSIGFPLSFFCIIGLKYLTDQGNRLFPVWSAYALLVYSLLITPRIDQYAVHFTPLLLIIGSFGVNVFIEKKQLSRMYPSLLILALILSTNSLFPLSLFSEKRFPALFMLHQRLAEFTNSYRNVEVFREAFPGI